jgi:hypothetical protein
MKMDHDPRYLPKKLTEEDLRFYRDSVTAADLPAPALLRHIAALEEELERFKEPSGVVLAKEQVEAAVRGFRAGLYRHYKGGFYAAIDLWKHHETRIPYVTYVSLTYGSKNIRPLVPAPGDPDSWTDQLRVGEFDAACPRFRHAGDQT